MRSLSESVDEEFCLSLLERLTRAAEETISTMFGYDITICDDNVSLAPDQVAVRVALTQGVEKLTLRFVYNYKFVMNLIGESNGDKPFSDETREVYEDAACELANIICNQIKAYLNRNQFLVIMELPYVESEADEAIKEDQKILTLSLSSNSPVVHSVNTCALYVEANVVGF